MTAKERVAEVAEQFRAGREVFAGLLSGARHAGVPGVAAVPPPDGAAPEPHPAWEHHGGGDGGRDGRVPVAADAYRLRLEEVYAALALDPIGARPWDLARLTDFQIERLYVRPAAKRAAELRAPGGAGPNPAAESVTDASEGLRRQIEAGGAPNKAAMMGLLMTLGGMTAKDATAEYDRQLADHRRARG